MNLIACVSQDWGIGYQNRLLFHIPKDMEYFKSKTLNKVVIMGKNTYQSLSVKPLPNRKNIVLSNSLPPTDSITLCKDIQEVYQTIAGIPSESIYIIGGETVYKTFFKECSTAYITKVYSPTMADKYFPYNLDTSSNWRLVENSDVFKYNNLEYTFNVYRNIIYN